MRISQVVIVTLSALVILSATQISSAATSQSNHADAENIRLVSAAESTHSK